MKPQTARLRLNNINNISVSKASAVQAVTRWTVLGASWLLEEVSFKMTPQGVVGGGNLIMPPPRRGGGGIKRSSASVVRLSVCLMLHTSALTRKPKGLGRRNFAQGYPRSHATPRPTSRSKGQKSRSAGAGAYCGGHLAAQLVSIGRLFQILGER